MKKLIPLVIIGLIFVIIVFIIFNKFFMTSEKIVDKEDYSQSENNNENYSQNENNNEDYSQNENNNELSNSDDLLNSDYSGDNIDSMLSGDMSYYDVTIDDETIIFSDENGGMIIYVFDNDRLYSVQQVITVDNKNEAEVLKNSFNSQVQNGEIEKITVNDTTISIVYNLDLFSEYKDYTLQQFKDIVLEKAVIVEEE